MNRVIIAGGRKFSDYELLEYRVIGLLDAYMDDLKLEIVSGGARGADKLGERFANEHNIPVKLFQADWGTYGHGAGPVRNQEMADYADVLVAFWDGESTGTNDMIMRAMHSGLDLHVFRYEK